MNRTPYLIDPDLTIYQGDALDPDRAVARLLRARCRAAGAAEPAHGVGVTDRLLTDADQLLEERRQKRVARWLGEDVA